VLKRDPQVLGGDVVPSIPLLLEFRSFLGKNFGQALHCRRYEFICLLDGTAGLIDKTGLYYVPTVPQIVKFVSGEQRRILSRFDRRGSRRLDALGSNRFWSQLLYLRSRAPGLRQVSRSQTLSRFLTSVQRFLTSFQWQTHVMPPF
jgi:hypothetical protein